MKTIFALFSKVLFLFIIASCNKSTQFPDDFNQRVYKHILHISNEIGERESSSNKEYHAANYIKDELEKIGIRTEIEEFQFETFDLDSAICKIADSKYAIKQIYFNPYRNVFSYQGDFITIDSTTNIKDHKILENNIVITTIQNDYFFFAKANPRIVVIVDTVDYKVIKSLVESFCILDVYGYNKIYTSQNVVGEINCKAETDDFILIGAHHDSYPTSPGADDNASGVGALIELGSYFNVSST